MLVRPVALARLIVSRRRPPAGRPFRQVAAESISSNVALLVSPSREGKICAERRDKLGQTNLARDPRRVMRHVIKRTSNCQRATTEPSNIGNRINTDELRSGTRGFHPKQGAQIASLRRSRRARMSRVTTEGIYENSCEKTTLHQETPHGQRENRQQDQEAVDH